MIGKLLLATAMTAGALASAPQSTAGDHETVGGGTFQVGDSGGGCTDFEAAGQYFSACPGQPVAVPFTKYIVVPLGAAAWVTCATFAPDGSMFEQDDEYAAEVPERQQYWAAHGWGAYTPMAMCQMW